MIWQYVYDLGIDDLGVDDLRVDDLRVDDLGVDDFGVDDLRVNDLGAASEVAVRPRRSVPCYRHEDSPKGLN